MKTNTQLPYKILSTLTLLTITLLLTACGGDNGKGKQNSNHGLINYPPLAKATTVKLKEDNTQTLILQATDEDNDTLGYRVTQQPKYGTLKGKAPNLSYTPNKDYNGQDSLGFIANDGVDDSEERSITLEIKPMADLKNIKLTLDKTTLNKEENVSYTIEATFDEGEVSQALQQSIDTLEIVSNSKDAIKTDHKNKTITALKDGTITLNAKVDTITSNTQTLQVIWEVNGHRLPPQPDKTLNDATLLGIDSNDNGVRDDVERWIYEKHGKKHPVNVAIAMEAAKVYQKIIEHPERAEELVKESDITFLCESYLMYSKDSKIKKIYPKAIDTGYFRKSIVFNTDARKKNYEIYNYLLSGSMFSSGTDKEEKAACMQIPAAKELVK